MIRTWKERGLVLLTAAPLLGVVPMAAGAHAEAPAPTAREGLRGAMLKPPPRPRTQAKPKPASTKPKSKKHDKNGHGKNGHGKNGHGKNGHGKNGHGKNGHGKKGHGKKGHGKKGKVHGGHVRGLVLRTSAPKKDVLRGRTYTWTYSMIARGPMRSGEAVFWMTLPRSLEFVSGRRHCTSSGQKVVCRLGTVRRGQRINGVIRAKVSKRARPGQTVKAHGTVMWGRMRVTRRFSAVRVAESTALATIDVASDPAVLRTKIVERR